MPASHPYILMLEDDADDRYITETTIADLGYNLAIKFLTNPREIIHFLTHSDEPPSLILMDYNPVHGVEILRQLKTHPDFNHIPVVVLSEAAASNHVRQCYQIGANSFIKKPATAEMTNFKIQTFLRYWFEVAET